MKSIAIDTVYGEQNYGNKLQNYALVKTYEKLGLSVVTLQVYQSALIQSYVVKLKKLIKSICFILPIKSWKKNVLEREKKFKRFSRKHLNLSPKYNTHTFHWSYLQKFDWVSVGSDQVWNDIDFDIDDVKYYSLYNAKDNPIIKKISFAASIGKQSFKKEYLNIFIDALKNYDFISVREDNAKTYLENLLSKKCDVFLDPTLWLSNDDWDLIIKRPKWHLHKQYDLLYFLGGYPDNFSKKENVYYVDVLDRNSIAYSASPEEFLFLIKNADHIYTDSFHACIFSMLYKKRFTVFRRKQQLSDMSSRIDSLFSLFQIQKKYNETISPGDYEKFESIREEKVNEEKEILNDVLNNR